jgi:H+-transporting ATPase
MRIAVSTAICGQIGRGHRSDGTWARGIVSAVKEGRMTFQRILTYTLRSMTRKINQMLFLTVGLIMTGHAILTPMLMVIRMTTGDFLAMSSTMDNVRPSAKPNACRIDNPTIAGIVLGTCHLIFCSTILAIGKFQLDLGTEALQTLAAGMVFSGQAVFCVVRDRRRLWSSRSGIWLVL